MALCRAVLVAVLIAGVAAVEPARAAADPAQDAALSHIENLRAQGKVEEAFAAYDAAIKDAEKQFGTKSARVSKLLHDAGILAMLLEKYSDAEARVRRAGQVEIAVSGAKHGNVAAIKNTLAQVLLSAGKYDEAQREAESAVSIAEGAFGAEHPNVGATLTTLAKTQSARGEKAKAEATLRRALALEEKGLGANHPAVAGTINDLALILSDQYRLAEAEALQKRVLSIAQKAYGENHPNNATALSSLAQNYLDQGRWDDASTLLGRAYDIRQKVLNKDNSALADNLNDLAWADLGRGDAAAAEIKFRHALELREKGGEKNPEVIAKGLENLARALRARRQFAEAQRQSVRALNVAEKAGAGDKPWVASILNGLAAAALGLNHGQAAEDFAQKALAIATEPDMTRVAALRILGEAELMQRKAAEAMEHAYEASKAFAARKADIAAAELRGEARPLFNERDVSVLAVRAGYAGADATRVPRVREKVRADVFLNAQLTGTGATSRAVWRMAARFAAHDDALAKVLREQQTLLLRLPEVETQYATLLSSGDAGARARADGRRKEGARIRARLSAIDAQLRKSFPEYAALADPQPVSAAEVSSILAPNEAAVQYVLGERDGVVFVATKQGLEWFRLDVGTEAIGADIAALREQLDPSYWQVLPPAIEGFDRARAYRLYQKIWQPMAAALKGKTTVFVVGDGPLASLPLGVLVTAAPLGGIDGDRSAKVLRETPWLIKQHALVTLPSLSSLKALRRYAARTGASEPFAGFGDPALGGEDDTRGAKRLPIAVYFRGSSPDLARLAELGSLPTTAKELTALAQAAGGDAAKDLWLRQRATETAIKQANLSRKRVVAFSTHGLMAGEIGQGEPGLVLTLPKKQSALDDGYLAASEVAELKLGSEWVILSACNTAAGEKPGAEGLSGLSKAFFMAGTKSMLVSHWSVWDDASAAITTGTLARLKEKKAPNRAVALQQSALALMADERVPRYAHPAAWAPFVLVGETVER